MASSRVPDSDSASTSASASASASAGASAGDRARGAGPSPGSAPRPGSAPDRDRPGTPAQWIVDSEPGSAGPIDGLHPGTRAVRDAAGRIVATIAGGNPLADDWVLPAFDGDLIIWSGSLGDDLTVPHPRTWMGPGRERLAERVAGLLPRVRSRGTRLLLRVHARQVLSDPPSVRAFLEGRADEPIGIVLEPAALFEASMLGPEAEDHLERILGGLGDLASVLALSDVQGPTADPADVGDAALGTAPCPRLVAAGDGELPPNAFAQAVDRWIDPAVPRLSRPGGGAAA